MIFAIVLAGVARAQTFTDSGTADPTPGVNDIVQLSTNGNTAANTSIGRPDGLNYYTDNLPPPGQTFTTTSTATNLISVAIHTAGLDSGAGYGSPGTTPTYYLRLYSVVGSTATLLTNFSAPNHGFTDGDWLSWNNLSMPLAANSTYAFSFGRQPSPGGWCALAVATNKYAGGQIALIPTNGGTVTFGFSQSYDAVFDLGMFANAPTANTPLVAPGTTVYAGQPLTLNESASGTGPLFYQWRTDGGGGGSRTNIPGANGTSVTAIVTAAATFKYDIIVTNSYGGATSSVVAVTVLPPTSVSINVTNLLATMPPQGLGVCAATYDNDLIDPSVAPMLSAAGITAVRYPGGSYADIFNWQTTSGNDGAYVNADDSFTNFMNIVVNPAGAQAIITVNYGSNPADNGGGDTNVAAAWVDFANNTKHWGIKYWEIGNEIGGNGYNGTNLDWEYDLHYPETNATTRVGQPALSPAAYGSNAVQFITAMKAKDRTIKCGVGFDTGGTSDNASELGQTGTNADFVIIHWYPGNDTASTLAASTGIVATVTSTFTQLTNAVGAAHAAQMQIAVTETGAGNVTGAPVALYAADNYLTWIENGIVNVDYQELHSSPAVFLQSDQQAAPAYYGAQMAHFLADVGDAFLKTGSGDSRLRVHATFRQDGRIGVMLVNLDPLTDIAATVNLGGTNLAGSGLWYQYGMTNFIGTSLYSAFPVSSNTVSGLSNLVTVLVPAYTIIDLLMPIWTNSPPALAAISNRTVNAGQTVAFTANATDPDSPPQTLTFALLAGATNTTLNTNSGAFSWRPWVAQSNTTNVFTLKVSDNGVPSLSATQNFTVVVNLLVPPALAWLTFTNQQLSFQVNGATGPDYAVQTSTNLLNWSTQFITNSPAMSFAWTDTNTPALPTRFYRIKAGPPLP